MEGVIASYRRGRKTQTGNQIIIHVEGVTSKDKAEGLIGKEVSWESSGKEKKTIKGKITSVHGRNGAVRALCESGIPGQALSTKIKIL